MGSFGEPIARAAVKKSEAGKYSNSLRFYISMYLYIN